MNDKLQIIICGPPGSYKTKIAGLIQDTIQNQIIPVNEVTKEVGKLRVKIFDYGRPLRKEEMEGLDVAIRTTTKFVETDNTIRI